MVAVRGSFYYPLTQDPMNITLRLRPGFTLLLGILLSLPVLAAPPSPGPSPTAPAAATAGLADIRVVIHTSKGGIAVTLFPSKAPLAVANFLNLAGHKFYDNLKFHRVIHGFMIQGGDPDGTGEGGPGYEFKDEISDLKFNKPGVLAMANRGQNTNGSQFFITHAPTPWLDGKFSILGQVTSGQPTVNEIEQGDVIQSIDILDPTGPLFAAEAAKIAEWDAALKERGAKPAPSPR
jgi:peptidyl-prolyl cis-trans isomerase B (cyclophilin B)